METIYVVMGTTGEEGDQEIWMVKAYTNEAKAEIHVGNATHRAEELYEEYPFRNNIPKGANEFDPGMKMDYNGTDYYYDKVELIREDE
jgi:hypothetical protein